MFLKKITALIFSLNFLIFLSVPCFSYSEIKNYQITDIKKEGLNESQSFQERIPCKQKEKKAILKIQAELKK
jgi:hypothetical protein